MKRGVFFFAMLVVMGVVFVKGVAPVLAATKCPLNAKTAYKAGTSLTVYYITPSCTKQGFVNPSAFFEKFTSWKQVKVTKKAVLDSVKNDNNFLLFPTPKQAPAPRAPMLVPVPAPLSPVVVAPPLPSIPTPIPQSQVTSLCGNGEINSGEACDGGDFCTSKCTLQTLLPLNRWVDIGDSGQTLEFQAGVGDRIAISADITVRIERILLPNLVYFSIWGKEKSGRCSLVSNTGMLNLSSGGTLSFREFTGGFLELKEIRGTVATMKKYAGIEARRRCEEIGDWKKPVACSFYSDNTAYYLQEGSFKIHFNEPSHQLAAEFTSKALNSCLAVMRQQLPVLQSITPFGGLWNVYATPYNNVSMTASADYQRIVMWYDLFPSRVMGEYTALLKNGRCPIEVVDLPHELTHVLFANTSLQSGYDAYRGSIGMNTPGSRVSYLTEGMAEFFAYWGTQNTNHRYFSSKVERCLVDRLADTNDGSTADQRMYRNILQGNGFGSNHYASGLCFFARVQKDCGDATLKNIFTKAIENSGSTSVHTTLFQNMAQTCSNANVVQIMNDFGFDPSYLTTMEKYPIDSFASGKTEPACF